MRDDLSNDERRLMAEQIEYYRARAPEYDEWFYRRGRFDHGEDFNRKWFAQVADVARPSSGPCSLGVERGLTLGGPSAIVSGIEWKRSPHDFKGTGNSIHATSTIPWKKCLKLTSMR